MRQYREASYISALEYYKYRSAITKLEFLLIIYQSKRVGGKILLKLNANDVGDEKHSVL